jgi:hypothetical protein
MRQLKIERFGRCLGAAPVQLAEFVEPRNSDHPARKIRVRGAMRAHPYFPSGTCADGFARTQHVSGLEFYGIRTASHEWSGSYSAMLVARLTVSFPKSFWCTTPSWLTMKVMMPLDP